jgi:hypothetical protein
MSAHKHIAVDIAEVFADYEPHERPDPVVSYNQLAMDRVHGREPERELNPPEPAEASLTKALEVLKQSLSQEAIKSPYWDDHALHFRDELDNMLLDKLALAVARKKKRFAFKLLTRALNQAYIEHARLNLSLGLFDE